MRRHPIFRQTAPWFPLDGASCRRRAASLQQIGAARRPAEAKIPGDDATALVSRRAPGRASGRQLWAAVPPPPPLPTLLSQALVADTIELDNEAEHRLPHRTTRHGGPDARGRADPGWCRSRCGPTCCSTSTATASPWQTCAPGPAPISFCWAAYAAGDTCRSPPRDGQSLRNPPQDEAVVRLSECRPSGPGGLAAAPCARRSLAGGTVWAALPWTDWSERSGWSSISWPSIHPTISPSSIRPRAAPMLHRSLAVTPARPLPPSGALSQRFSAASSWPSRSTSSPESRISLPISATSLPVARTLGHACCSDLPRLTGDLAGGQRHVHRMARTARLRRARSRMRRRAGARSSD